ncbi:MAG: hypothetical protein R3Y28_02585 [Candidatus Gastranaerophilales bacterium]
MSYLSDKYPFLMNYFENGINMVDKNIAHCILFYGSDLGSQYSLSLEIARMLNCRGSHTQTCECLNCRWIRENKHPAVLTISRLDNKPSSDTSKTVISVAQSAMIKKDLLVSSEYHRVFVFCDKDDEGNVLGLNQKNFQPEAANSLLKTFEEPPSNTTFIFLTKDKSDMINTIVSRSQCFYVPSKASVDDGYELVDDVFGGYLELERENVLDLIDRIIVLIKDNDALEIFSQMQNYINMLLQNSLQNPSLKLKLIRDLKSVEKAKSQVALNMQNAIVVENLCYDLILNN